ncbi:unnamed protein product [Pieris macdunnoughi]|uniref:Uncharacterized protein n=1 Tax=Pieris macdunnoughi TaxID=345717 RepID=A0A821LGL4_9NEOP|nr:unnamed protein product [Pieris macdunnoughi]
MNSVYGNNASENPHNHNHGARSTLARLDVFLDDRSESPRTYDVQPHGHRLYLPLPVRMSSVCEEPPPSWMSTSGVPRRTITTTCQRTYTVQPHGQRRLMTACLTIGPAGEHPTVQEYCARRPPQRRPAGPVPGRPQRITAHTLCWMNSVLEEVRFFVIKIIIGGELRSARYILKAFTTTQLDASRVSNKVNLFVSLAQLVSRR